MKTKHYLLPLLLLWFGISAPIKAQLKVKNSNGKVTIGSTIDAEEILEVYGDGQIFGQDPYLRFKLSTNPGSGSEGGLHWRNNLGVNNMRLYYAWNLNKLFIGATDNENNAHLTIDNFNGNIGIGTMSPSSELEVNGDIAVSGQIVGVSDRRTKEHIRSLEPVLERIMQIEPVDYYYRTDQFTDLSFPEKKQVGFIAQDIETLFPEIVTDFAKLHNKYGELNLKGIDYLKMIPILTKAIQEQQKMINALLDERNEN